MNKKKKLNVAGMGMGNMDMDMDTCSFCKGTLKKGKTEFTVKSGNSIVSVKNVPAYICENCGEAYFDPDFSRRIDKVMSDFVKGELLAHPLAAGEIEFDRVASLGNSLMSE